MSGRFRRQQHIRLEKKLILKRSLRMIKNNHFHPTVSAYFLKLLSIACQPLPWKASSALEVF
jgi:hypothetical protein